MTTKFRNAAQVAEQRILELSAAFTNAISTATMPNTQTIKVPHLGGIRAAYQMPKPYNPSLPTLVLVNSFTTSSELYRSQYANKDLTDNMNLLALELLGHGQTRVDNQGTGSVFEGEENWTYWDTAIMNLQVLEALGVKGKVLVLGTSQGGWICVRMALLAPKRIAGIIPLGTSMDFESQRTRDLGCWNGPGGLDPNIAKWTTTSNTADFEPNNEYCDFLINIGFGEDVADDVRQFWRDTIKSNYQGDDGRRRIRMAAINLSQRDSLHARLSDVKCPVLWLHGTDDAVYSVANAKEEIEMLVNAESKELRVVEGGKHFLSFSHPEVVDKAVQEFVGRYGNHATDNHGYDAELWEVTDSYIHISGAHTKDIFKALVEAASTDIESALKESPLWVVDLHFLVRYARGAVRRDYEVVDETLSTLDALRAAMGSMHCALPPSEVSGLTHAVHRFLRHAHEEEHKAELVNCGRVCGKLSVDIDVAREQVEIAREELREKGIDEGKVHPMRSIIAEEERAKRERWESFGSKLEGERIGAVGEPEPIRWSTLALRGRW